MPITQDLGGKNYTLARGRLFFDQYPQGVAITGSTQGTGERYIGNTPEISTTSSSESLDHYDSDAGLRVKDASVQLSLDRTGSFVTDNIDQDNLALFFLGEADTVTETSATGVISLVTGNRGRFFQLGVTEATPTGMRKISNVVVKKGVSWATTVVATNNYELDEDRGRIYIELDSADISDGTPLQITFDRAANARKQVVSKTNAIYGALRYVGQNPIGENRDYYFPYVKLSPDGDYNLKGDEWLQMGFSMEILKKGALESVYIDDMPATS